MAYFQVNVAESNGTCLINNRRFSTRVGKKLALNAAKRIAAEFAVAGKISDITNSYGTIIISHKEVSRHASKWILLSNDECGL